MKTRLALVLCAIVLIHAAAKSQVKIGDNATTINSASLLELETTNRGFVLPRVSITNVNSSTPLAAGLLTGTIVYNTNSSTAGGSGLGIYYWDGSKWNFLTNTTFTGNYWSITGNSGTSPSSNFIGTTDAKDFVARTNNVERMRILGVASGSSQVGWIGMGVTLPKSALDVAGNYSGKNVITIQNTSSTGFSSVDMLDNAGNLATTFGFANSGTGTAFSGKAYLNGYGNDFLFTRGSSYDLIMKGSNGYVGLNTSTPSERLHVVGNFYLTGAFMPGGNAGTSGYVLTSAGTNTAPTWNNLNGLSWALTGNSGTNASTNFIGTTDVIDFVARTSNIERLRITSAGNVGIGLTNPAYKLAVLSTSNPLYLSGVQATSTLSADSVLTINAGVVKKAPFSSFSTSTTNALTLSGNTLTSTVNGVAATSSAVSGVSNASNTNTLSTTVNGVTGTGVSIINSNTKTWTEAGGLTTTVNGVSSNVTPASGTVADILGYNSTGVPVYQSASDILGGLTTNTLALSGNTITSTVNGVAATSNAVSGVSNTSSTNTLSTTVNGVTGTGVSIINSNTKTWTQAGGLTTTVNGVASTVKPASGTVTNILGYNSSGAPVYQPLSNINLNTTWNLLGNSGTSYSTNFLGTTDNVSMRFRTKNIQRMIIDSTGNVGIGLNNPSNALSVVAASDPLYLSGLQATSTLNADSILTINAGVVKKTPYSSLSGSFWSLTGNSGTNYSTNFLGTTDNVSLRFRTNNTEQMILDSLGTLSVGSYGAATFNTDNPPKLSVDYNATTSNTIAYLRGSINSYLQINLRNKSNGAYASSDYVATSDDGTDSTNYIDLGINSSGYAPSVDNFGGPHDGYLYTYSRNLIIGTQKASSDIIFLSGGGQTKYNAVLRMDGATGNIVIGRGENNTNATGNIIRGPNGGGTNIPGGSLTLQGGSGTGTGSGGYLYLNGGTTSTGTAGNIVMSTASTERLRVDQSGNVGIGIANPAYKLSVLSSSNPLYLSGVQATTTFSSDSILTINGGVVKKTPYSSLPSGGSGWLLTGNSGTNTTTNFLGTTDNTGLIFKVNNTEAGYLANSFSQATAFGYNSSGTLTGQYATAIGATSQATSQYASAFGYASSAVGQYSTALGYNASANFQYASAFGANSSAANQFATALGYNASATSQSAVAVGYNSTANNQDAVAAGNGSNASTAQSIAIGRQAVVSGYQGIAIGSNSAATTGSNTLAIGVSSSASGFQAAAIGNSSVASNSQALAVGNGASAAGTNSTAIGNGATTSQNNALILGNSSVNVGIATSTPSTSASLDVNGNFKFGDIGTVNKNIVSFAYTLGTTGLAAGSFGVSSFAASSTDVTVTIPSASNYLTSTRATVTVSPGFDFPASVSIASARMISTTQLKIRFVNASTTAANISGSLYITINEF